MIMLMKMNEIEENTIWDYIEKELRNRNNIYMIN